MSSHLRAVIIIEIHIVTRINEINVWESSHLNMFLAYLTISPWLVLVPLLPVQVSLYMGEEDAAEHAHVTG